MNSAEGGSPLKTRPAVFSHRLLWTSCRFHMTGPRGESLQKVWSLHIRAPTEKLLIISRAQFIWKQLKIPLVQISAGKRSLVGAWYWGKSVFFNNTKTQGIQSEQLWLVIPPAALRRQAAPLGYRCRWSRPCRFSSCSRCCPGEGWPTAERRSWAAHEKQFERQLIKCFICYLIECFKKRFKGDMLVFPSSSVWCRLLMFNPILGHTHRGCVTHCLRVAGRKPTISMASWSLSKSCFRSSPSTVKQSWKERKQKPGVRLTVAVMTQRPWSQKSQWPAALRFRRIQWVLLTCAVPRCLHSV